MAADRFVLWKSEKPTQEEIQFVLEDFLGEVATEIRWDTDRFFVTLVGKYSHPLKRVVTSPIARRDIEPGWDGRHLEVIVGKADLDVLTRRQDEFTMRVADGLADVFARFWAGELET